VCENLTERGNWGGVAASIGRFSADHAAMALKTRDSYIPLPETIASFLMLVEICKGLIMKSCLASSE
jgi:hypothetical protein